MAVCVMTLSNFLHFVGANVISNGPTIKFKYIRNIKQLHYRRTCEGALVFHGTSACIGRPFHG